DLDETPLDEPVHGPGREDEDTFEPEGAGALLDALQYPLAVALALDLRGNGERRHLAGPRLRIGIERGAAEDHAVVLDHGVVADVALDLGPVALDERAVALERLDQLQHAADVVGRRLAQALELLVADDLSYAAVREHLHQQRTVDRERQDVRALDTTAARAHAVLQVESGVGRLVR